MAINLDKNRDSLKSAWRDVLDDKTDTNWALFGYEGQSNDLKVISKGSEGLEELVEDLNSGKVMYAFVKVNDPKTSLDKCVLINWQGEGANILRKGLCANHLRDVENFFTGAQLTYTARNEDEMEPQLIIQKIAKAGSAYSFKTPKDDIVEPTGPVGTTYQRVNPVKEINSKERDQFWRKEEEEEKRRIEEDRKRREAEKIRLEEEAKKRELAEYSKREAENVTRNNNIDQIKEAEKVVVPSQDSREREHYAEENVPKVNQSELLRKQRKQEAEDLISQRTIDARSIFEKHTSTGQIKKTPEKPVRNSILKAQAQAQSIQQEVSKETVKNEPVSTQYLEPERVFDEPSDEEESDQYSTIKRSPRDADKKSVSSPTSPQEVFNNVVNKQDAKKDKDFITDQQFVDEYLYGFTTPGLQARALYDYQAADDTEITFDPGDVITNIDQVDEGWWQGLGPDGTYGLFPANYVELLN